MARLITWGFEWGNPDADCSLNVAGQAASTLAARTGTYGMRWSSAATLVSALLLGATSRTYYLRVYVRFSANPSVKSDIIGVINTAGAASGTIRVALNTDGTVQLEVPDETLIGSASAALTANTWYRIELMVRANTGANDDHAELRIDGTTIASTTTANWGTTAPNRWSFGNSAQNPGVNIDFDDGALNDDQGSLQNSWPGEGNVLLLIPTADAQVGSWTGGAGGTTNLFAAIDNKPPTGTASETDSTQIENGDTSPDNSTDEYRITMQSYSTSGVPGGSTVNVAQTVTVHGEDVSTGTKTGSVLLASNPTQSAADTFTFGDDVGALGTFPATWKVKNGAGQDASGVTLGTAPVVHLRKTDTGNRVASACAVGIYADYTVPSGPAASLILPNRSQNRLVRQR